jgi:hypothetical protein
LDIRERKTNATMTALEYMREQNDRIRDFLACEEMLYDKDTANNARNGRRDMRDGDPIIRAKKARIGSLEKYEEKP